MKDGKHLPKRIEMQVDLDGFDLATSQGFGTGVPLVTFEFLQGGKKVYVHVDLFQHEMKQGPTLRIAAMNKGRDVLRELQVKPWALEHDGKDGNGK